MSETLRSKLKVGRSTLHERADAPGPVQIFVSHCVVCPDAGDDRLGGGDGGVQRYVHG